ncbi:Disintegrin and metalloproteinase domain-containing protein 12 [Melipona quadrifasciata]|uniref:Disintegrin and metalloproteinase domain-containing protein 12 n=1 Tax=Melipona quadrifasciata TaxID=166423 RepID=A0A0N0BD37_9HYME|nr:Disintegrin and metalloproteinase domain-containing protein 12 [Melipona quadrifasciata]
MAQSNSGIVKINRSVISFALANELAEKERAGPEWNLEIPFRVCFYLLLVNSGMEGFNYTVDVEHADVLTVGFELDGVKRVLDLRLNADLIPVGYQQRHQHQGTYKVHTPAKVELCHYQGSVRDVPGSWVALSTCRGLRGVVFDGENLHHIHPDEGESLDSEHYVYKHSDLVANHTCGYDGTPHHVLGHEHHGIVNRATRVRCLRRLKRISIASAEAIRGPYNANRHSRYVELVLVIDKEEYIALDENMDKVYQHCKDIANIINALYMPLNIFIALVGVQVWSDVDEITLSSNGDTTLSNFLRYRREKLVQDMPNDNAQLLTRVTFEGGVVGKALKGPICTYEFSGGVSMDHSNVVGLVAATVAHEMGHNFGMEHDSADCECPEEKCIMASSSGSLGPTHWSTCSLEHLALAFEHGMDYCLRNKPQKLFDSPICGNGFVEPGEQCDCGLKENCDNPCCNVTTCMLHSNASCATGECCDLKTCRPKTAGTECRTAEHECDLPEYCTGQSEYCPVDVFKMDGESCSMGKAFCYQGSCRTHNDQCKLLWGPTGTSSDAQCYEMNNKGTKHGNCGYNRVESSYVKCTDENLLCGMLHCKHLNERLEFGMESVAILSHSFINNGGKIIACRSAIVDLGLNQVDPGLAPDGAKCAPGKMCVNQKCMPVADLRASVSGGKACPNNCGGNGVCNSLGHCHCNRGFRPPDCTQPGVGGSEDSGPAEDPNDAINCSNSIAMRKSMLLGNVDQSVGSRKSDVSDSDQAAQPSFVDGQARKNSIRTELGTKIAERIQQMQKKPTKNIKGLTVKTEVKFEHLNESPSGSSTGITPRTGDPLMPDKKPCLKAPAPFYNKKPPPPPAPAQSLKPKI